LPFYRWRYDGDVIYVFAGYVDDLRDFLERYTRGRFQEEQSLGSVSEDRLKVAP
jgi:hypothetical protein